MECGVAHEHAYRYRCSAGPVTPGIKNLRHPSNKSRDNSCKPRPNLPTMEVYESLGLTLVILYCACFLLSFAQVCRILVYQHQLFSFQSGFLVLTSAWSVVRAVFFFRPLPQLSSFLLYWIATDLQFATFALLVAFYASILYRTDGRWLQSRRAVVMTLYVACCVFSVVLTAAYLVIMCAPDTPEDCPENPMLDTAHHITIAAQFFILLACFGLYAIRLHRHKVGGGTQQMSNLGGTSTDLVYGLTIAAFLVFASRFVYNVVTACGYWTMPIVDSATGGVKSVSLLTFALFLVWEVAPSVSVVLFFRRIPRTAVRRTWLRLCGCMCDVDAAGLSHTGEPFGSSMYSTPTLQHERFHESPFLESPFTAYPSHYRAGYDGQLFDDQLSSGGSGGRPLTPSAGHEASHASN